VARRGGAHRSLAPWFAVHAWILREETHAPTPALNG
jgi:hypothetical protein